jgi:hypothetical protein
MNLIQQVPIEVRGARPSLRRHYRTLRRVFMREVARFPQNLRGPSRPRGCAYIATVLKCHRAGQLPHCTYWL